MSNPGDPPAPWGSSPTPGTPPPSGGPFGAPPPGGFPPPPPPAPPAYGAPAPGGYGAPPPPAYGAPPPGGFGPAPGGFTPNPTNGLAIAALVTGILALLGSFIPVLNWFTSPLALVAIGLGIAGLSRAKRVQTGKGMAVGGLVTGVLAVLITVAWTVVLVTAADEIDSDPSDGVCNEDRFFQDPDCGSGGINTDTPDGVCDEDRFLQDPDC